MVINGMRDFNLNYEILKASERSLELYGLSSDIFRKGTDTFARGDAGI